MAAYVYAREIKDEEYLARVRRHTPSSLLPLIGQVGAQYWEPNSWLHGDYMKCTPWALADIARVSLVSGNEHRRTAMRRDLLECGAAYSAHRDPELARQEADSLVTFLLRTAFEQFGFNQSRYHDLLRTAAIFLQTTPLKELKVIQPGWDEELFGCTLSQYVGIGFIVHSVAVRQNGRFLETWLDDPTLAPITSEIPVSLIANVIDANFTGDTQFYQQERPKFSASPFRRFTYSPLVGRPIVSGITDERLVPVPGLVDRKISPLGVWHAGHERWKQQFAIEVGELFEQYVGRHLALISDSTLIPEITYDKDNKRSVDWIVVGENAVLLVEVKSARPTEPIRLGSKTVWDELATKFTKAYAQIEKASQKIEDNHSAFSEVPSHLPRIGLIVTMEPFPVVNLPVVRTRLNVSPSMPTCVCSSEELELLVTMKDEPVDNFLLQFQTGARTYCGPTAD